LISNRPFNALRFVALVLGILGTLSGGNEARSAPAFASTQPSARVEHWQKREAAINAHLRDSKDLSAIKLLFVGDSITDFWLFDDNPWVSGQKYGRKVWDESFAKPGSENYAFNIGISGDRIEHILYRILPKSAGGLGQLDAPQLNPEFMVVMLGINNSWAVEEPVADSIFEGVHVALSALHARKPRSRIVLQSLLPTNDTVKNRDVVRVVNERLAKLASSPEFSRFTRYLDLYPAFTDATGMQISGYFTDGLHPNEVGYSVWRDQLVPFLKASRASSYRSTTAK
jgi:lysophospholipase L1-like esterase